MKYRCNNCDNTTLRWEGKCSSCGEWGTLEEFEDSAVEKSSIMSAMNASPAQVTPIANQIEDFLRGRKEVAPRISSGIGEFDRVIGSGFVDGEVILVTGEPGIGKSTLLSQLALIMSVSHKVLYVAGEESISQVAQRFLRLSSKGGLVAGYSSAGTGSSSLNSNGPITRRRSVKVDKSASQHLSTKASDETLDGRAIDASDETEIALHEIDRISAKIDIDITQDTDVDRVVALLEKSDHKIVIVDSIQSVRTSLSKGYPGSISQVRQSGQRLVESAKRLNKIMIIVGQINKEGAIAGPKVLEHMVDAVLHFEGSKDGYYRVIRPLKNRFGATTEIGIFEMVEHGFREVPDPSEIFIDKSALVPGSAIGALVEGSRVVLLEVQALVVEHGSSPGPLRRVANGIKKPRLEMLCAVISRRGGIFLGDKDVYLNISGGLNVNSTSMDLAVCAAIKSSISDKALRKDHVYAGEVGLTGEVKRFLGIDQIAKEVKRMGYKKVLLPSVSGESRPPRPKETHISYISNISTL